MMGTEKVVKYLVQEKIKITVVINKIDRLILELKIPPADAYLKIKHSLEEINGFIQSAAFHLSQEEKDALRVSPVLNNVAFASAYFGFVFTLSSFSAQYKQRFPTINAGIFQQMLWGDYYYQESTRTFAKKPTKDNNLRTFVQFILNPLYKLVSRTISHELQELQPLLTELNIFIKKVINNTFNTYKHHCK